MENDYVVSGNGTCKIDVQNMVLDFLQSCDEVNGTRFGLLSLVSLGYVLGETLLIVGIDTIGRRPYLSKHKRPPRIVIAIKIIQSKCTIELNLKSSEFFIRNVFQKSQFPNYQAIFFIIAKTLL